MTNHKYLSIDIGGTNIKYGLINQAGQISFKAKLATPGQKEPFLAAIDQLIADYAPKVNGIAFCAPGKIEKSTIRFGGALPFLDGIDFAKRYRHLALPLTVINDGKAAALAESWLGNLKDIKNGAAIILGTGVGGGIIINGQLLVGSHFQAGELSYMIMDPTQTKSTEDSPMGPGFTGGTLSAVGLIKKINELTKHEDLLDGLVAFKELEAGTNQQVTALFEEYCHHVACLIMNVQSVVDLEKFVIGGGISAQPLVIKGINQAYDDLYHTNEAVALTLCRPQITVAKFNNDANLYGALYQLLLTTAPEKFN